MEIVNQTLLYRISGLTVVRMTTENAVKSFFSVPPCNCSGTLLMYRGGSIILFKGAL